MRIFAAALALLIVSAPAAEARLDLANASVERLDNGLTLIMLEDRTFPVASVHMSYKTGAKDDPAGRLGLAHFFEHMAFRGSKKFPDLGLTSEIYAAGGEWHGYTWIDNTNYFATAPKAELPLLLDIDADRMARLELRKEDIEAERGAVLAEMNGYANDPDSTLFDALMAAHFLTHPYRNNTIGYLSDIGAITHEDVIDFYERNYAPQNAVLAIVGDIDRGAVRTLVKKKFGKIKKKVRPRAPLTAEMPRSGERCVTIALPSHEKLFKIAYPAPAASHPDFAAFLVLQALIGETSGVNFNQNDWGTPVGDGSPIAGAADGVRTWIIPTAEPYAFVVSGSATTKSDEAKVENAIQSAFDAIAKSAPSASTLETAKRKLGDALAFDVDTTEEAAHQLAYFAGIGAFDQLLLLEDAVRNVTADDIRAIASKYLRRDQRTIAWLKPGPATKLQEIAAATETKERQGATSGGVPAITPRVTRTDGGLALLFIQSSASPTLAVKMLIEGRYDCSICVTDEFAFEKTIISAVWSKDENGIEQAIKSVADALATAKPLEPLAPSDEPLTRVAQVFEKFAANGSMKNGPHIWALSASGDIDIATVRPAFEKYFPQKLSILAYIGAIKETEHYKDFEFVTEKPKAQSAIGYIATLIPDDEGALPMELALYTLSHGYGGRLGQEAISRRGLVYYIDAAYRPYRGYGFATISAGVDPDKVDAFRDLMKAEIARLKSEPPTEAEIAEAKRHLLGRKISASQSNEEIAEAMLRDFLAVGAPESAEAFKARLDAVTRDDILNAIEALQKGAVVTVRGGGVD